MTAAETVRVSITWVGQAESSVTVEVDGEKAAGETYWELVEKIRILGRELSEKTLPPE